VKVKVEIPVDMTDSKEITWRIFDWWCRRRNIVAFELMKYRPMKTVLKKKKVK